MKLVLESKKGSSADNSGLFVENFRKKMSGGKIEKEIKQLGAPQPSQIKAFSFRRFTGPF